MFTIDQDNSSDKPSICTIMQEG